MKLTQTKYKICQNARFVKIQDLSKYKICSKFKMCQNSRFVKMQDLSKFKICQNSRFVKIQDLSFINSSARLPHRSTQTQNAATCVIAPTSHHLPSIRKSVFTNWFSSLTGNIPLSSLLLLWNCTPCSIHKDNLATR